MAWGLCLGLYLADGSAGATTWAEPITVYPWPLLAGRPQSASGRLWTGPDLFGRKPVPVSREREYLRESVVTCRSRLCCFAAGQSSSRLCDICGSAATL